MALIAHIINIFSHQATETTGRHPAVFNLNTAMGSSAAGVDAAVAMDKDLFSRKNADKLH